ncbi:hypothetical protein T05_8374 [Trichinella murrelli]|uniref:Uncharacterized protein n=1 Tax=Trichinella murrelli TaxID=144512 RepID=A0A0V0TI30_9BILA|nr:hypothetical protein T05_2294 [Trichinella murrelli]KRX38245.1 hypothetical protein T05_8374 [Trichinella murrelli]
MDSEILQIMFHVSEKRLRRRNADENWKKQSNAGAQYKTEPEERPSADCAWRARSVRSVRSVAVERVRALVVLRHCFVCLLDRRSADKVCYSQDCLIDQISFNTYWNVIIDEILTTVEEFT